MHLPQIVEIVRHTSTHDRRRIIFQQIEQVEHAQRVGVEPRDPGTPGQPQACALGHETANMRVRVFRPRAKGGERPLGVFGDVRPDAELGAEAPGELVLRTHRQVEVIEPALGDDHQVRHVEERRHPGADELIRLVLGTERSKKHVDGIGVRRGKVRGERARDVPSTIQELEIVEPGARLADEAARRERRVHPHDVSGKPANERGREEGLEGVVGHAR